MMLSTNRNENLQQNGPDTALAKDEELVLIARAQQGDNVAAGRLVESHRQRLFTFVWRIVRNADMAEEICQDAFLRAFGSLSSFKKEYRFSTWLFTIGYRLSLNQIRRQKTRKSTSSDFSNMPAPDQSTQLDKALQSEHASRLREMLWEEVDKLSDVQRAAVLMFYREGLSCKEVAEVLEIPIATVKSHMHRARGRLRDRLQRLGVDDRDLAHLGA